MFDELDCILINYPSCYYIWAHGFEALEPGWIDDDPRHDPTVPCRIG